MITYYCCYTILIYYSLVRRLNCKNSIEIMVFHYILFLADISKVYITQISSLFCNIEQHHRSNKNNFMFIIINISRLKIPLWSECKRIYINLSTKEEFSCIHLPQLYRKLYLYVFHIYLIMNIKRKESIALESWT